MLTAHVNWQQGLLCKQVEGGLTCMIFRKSLLINTVTMARVGSGTLQTLMAVDTARVVNVVASGHELWGLPLQIGVALWLLWTQVEFAFLAGLAVVVLLIPINRVLAMRIQAASERLMTAKDARIKVCLLGAVSAPGCMHTLCKF